MQSRELMDGRADCMFSTGADGAKQRLEGGDTDEKKSQISADSGLSVTSGSQVGVNLISQYKSLNILFYFEVECMEIYLCVLFHLLYVLHAYPLSRRVIQSPWRAPSLLLSREATVRTQRLAQW